MNTPLLEGNGFNQLKKFRYGYCLYNTNDIYIGKSIQWYGEYCNGEVELFSQICKKGDIVVEVGANIGVHTVALSQLIGASGKIYAFEPQRIIFQTLCANLALNSITNAYAYEYALGEQAGEIFIPEVDYTTKNNFGGVTLNHKSLGAKIPLISLDSFLNLNRLKLLKIDVEGMELEVLKGARNIISKTNPIIYVENDRVEKSQFLIEYLWELNYKLFWHLPPLFNHNNYFNNNNNLIGNFIAINMLCIPNDSKIEVCNLIEVTSSKQHPTLK
jgi:FkbM family methyltransferase